MHTGRCATLTIQSTCSHYNVCFFFLQDEFREVSDELANPFIVISYANDMLISMLGIFVLQLAAEQAREFLLPSITELCKQHICNRRRALLRTKLAYSIDR